MKGTEGKNRFWNVNRKSRSLFYPRTSIERFRVPDDKLSWQVKWPEYDPYDFTAPHILGQPWADPDISNAAFQPRWNALDSNIDRTSACGTYEIADGRPLNPIGRTGLRGRGLLGRWGPNKTADPIVTRWKLKDGFVSFDALSMKPILQFLAIEKIRVDCRQWSVPGGTVDVGEHISDTLRRALDLPAKSELQSFFASGVGIFNGYVDDSRNTDNAWLETTAVHFHDENHEVVAPSQTRVGDNILNIRWMDVSADLKLPCDDMRYVRFAALHLDAHWSNL